MAAVFSVHWSPDGKQLCVTRFASNQVTMWEVERDGNGLHQLTLRGDRGFWSADGRYFIFQAVLAGRLAVWTMGLSSGLFTRSKQPIPLGPAGLELDGVTLSPDLSRLYCLGRTKEHHQIERFDASARQFRPFLPGVSATIMESTKDGRWIAYVDEDGRLWKCRNDGSEGVQLTWPPLRVELPRWSPDGKQLAFMGQDPGGPWKVRVFSVESGVYSSLASDDAAEGAPTWSPDGSRIVFGGLVDPGHRVPGPLVIHIFDLKQGRLSVVPGSEGLWTARWSPDGRYIAALTADSRSLMLFDFRTGQWTRLLRLEEVLDLHWAAQGECMYSIVKSNRGETDLFRVDIPRHQAERLTTLESGDWPPLGRAPDDSPLITHRLNNEEIYALQCQFP
jgi:Tol biopolymer transport system component